jgi:hypothetical protein
LRDDHGRVAAPAIEPIEFTTVGAELDGAGPRRVLGANPAEERPFTVSGVSQAPIRPL